MLAKIFAWTGRRSAKTVFQDTSDANSPPALTDAGIEDQSTPEAPLTVDPHARSVASAGIMDGALLQDFLNANHFGLGVHNGANLRTRDALDQGKAELVAKFANVVGQLAQQTETRLNRLRDKEVETNGVCPTTTERIQLACKAAEREIATYKEQSQLAAREQGWVAEPLLKYQMGFRKGLADALEFELITR